MAWHPLGWTPVFFSEIEAFPSAVLAHHYGSNMPGEPLTKNGIPNHGDFTKIGPETGPIDLLVGGTPCQSFSVAGKRLGLDDPRGNLALEYLSLARRLRARWIVWENVPGVVSSVTDEEDGEGGVQPGLEGREAGDEWIEESDFATFLSFVRECGYGFAYRFLDAQYVRVHGFGRAVPQRRRRVFLVGYLGDWRRAAAVLLEPQGMRGDSPPSREAGQGAAGNTSYGISPDCFDRDGEGTGGTAAERSGLGLDRNLSYALRAKRPGGVAHPIAPALTKNPYADNGDGREGLLVAFGGNNRAGPIDVATAVNAHGGPHGRLDFESETFIAFDCKASGQNGFSVGEIAPTLRAMGHLNSNQNAGGQIAVAHSLRAEGFDASEDGTGRGTPIVPVPPYTLAIRGRGDDHQLEYRQDGTANAILTPNGGRAGIGVGAIATEWAVRRLTPTECERLQGFPDNFTNVPWGKKETSPDGPRYRALGNSMACNAMRWIGQRIDIMEKLINAGRTAE